MIVGASTCEVAVGIMFMLELHQTYQQDCATLCVVLISVEFSFPVQYFWVLLATPVRNSNKVPNKFREEGQSRGTAKPLRSPARPGLPGLLICLFVSPNPVTIQYLPIDITWASGGPQPSQAK